MKQNGFSLLWFIQLIIRLLLQMASRVVMNFISYSSGQCASYCSSRNASSFVAAAPPVSKCSAFLIANMYAI